MKAMVLGRPGERLRLAELPMPEPRAGQVLVKVRACAVCRTDLHVVDGELTEPKLPIVPGHEIVGEVVRAGRRRRAVPAGERVGIPWLGCTCGSCRYCASGQENLCDLARFTGYPIDGGYAEYTVADARYCFPLPERLRRCRSGAADVRRADRLSLARMAGDCERLGIYGFGAAAHIVAQVPGTRDGEVYAFTRPGDPRPGVRARARRGLGRRLRRAAAGGAGRRDHLRPGRAADPGGAASRAQRRRRGRGGIHMSDIPSFPYRILWGERMVRSVANLTRRDAEEFLALAPHVPVRTEVERSRSPEANEALERLRTGRIRGAAVLRAALGFAVRGLRFAARLLAWPRTRSEKSGRV